MKRLCTPAWIVRHVLTVALVVGFLALGWWQISRALAGNTLSWAYAFEWPIFAGFVVFLWVREARYTLRGGRPSPAEPAAPPARPTTPGVRRPVRTARPRLAAEGPEDPALTEYNHYLGWLNANPGARPADYPGLGRQQEG
ncbi:hypothetical protein ABGB07_37695 [Micromonosporaceae bacterium B7E4]